MLTKKGEKGISAYCRQIRRRSNMDAVQMIEMSEIQTHISILIIKTL